VWYQLQIEQCHRDGIEELSEALEETGALSITLTDKNDDPVLEPEPGTTPLWPDVIINALYDDEQLAQLALQQFQQSHPQFNYSMNTVADQDWERAWMEDFKPQRFGHRLWICPSWCEPPDPEAVNLILDPGLAFGTGTHPTTSLCLNWLDQADLHDKTVIDYGCGSGILALAAIKLGATHVQAIDIDPQALQATKNNAERNAIKDEYLTIGLPAILTTPVNTVIANILLAPLMRLANDFHTLLGDKGTLVVSGILTEQAPELIAIYRLLFDHLEQHNADGWSLLVFEKKG